MYVCKCSVLSFVHLIVDVGVVSLFQVEWLLMRAMSLGLIKGIMDEVHTQHKCSNTQ